MMKKEKSLYLTISIALLVCMQINGNSTGVRLVQVDPATGGTISESGNYYLGYDITGSLTIGADNVTLNLNGHTIHSLSIADHNDVIVTNGIVDGSSLTSGTPVALSGFDNVHLSHLSVLNAGANNSVALNGITISSGTNLFLSHILVEGNGAHGCIIQSSTSAITGLFISDCEFRSNGQIGAARNGVAFIGGSTSISDVIFRRCTSTCNAANGFSLQNNCQRIYFIDCIAFNNFIHGFSGSGSDANTAVYTAIRCFSELHSGDGFHADTFCEAFFENCDSYVNTNGFFNEGSSFGLVKECTAVSNSTCGINNNGVTTDAQPVSYVANYSRQTAAAGEQNYCINAISTDGFPYCTKPFADNNAQFWRNISS